MKERAKPTLQTKGELYMTTERARKEGRKEGRKGRQTGGPAALKGLVPGHQAINKAGTEF